MSALNLNNKMQSQEIYLDSRYASVVKNAGSNSDVLFFLAAPIIVDDSHDIVMRLENFVLPISFFAVNSNNNSLVFNGTTYKLTQGNYNAVTMQTLLQSLLGITVSYDSATNKFTFQSSTTFTVSYTSTCFRLLGFTEDVSHTSTKVGNIYSLTSDVIVNLSGTSVIYIDIPNVNTRNISAKNDGGFTRQCYQVHCV